MHPAKACIAPRTPCREDEVVTLGDEIGAALVEDLIERGVGRGSLVAIALAPGVGIGFAADGVAGEIVTPDAVAVVAAIEQAIGPRWCWWSGETAALLARHGVRVARCWDVAAVHRLLFGGWRADPARAWARLHGLRTDALPGMGQLDLLASGGGSDGDGDGGDPELPVRPDGHLRPEWADGGWRRGSGRLARWAGVVAAVVASQHEQLAALEVGGDPLSTARAESAAELLCVELAADGLPIDVAEAERIIGSFVGPRPTNDREVDTARSRRDDAVLEHALGRNVDLRNPAQVKAMLERLGIDVPNTRAHRLERLRDAHPIIEPLLAWRKAERIATTYGYGWLDEHVGRDARLRGAWTACDGAAGRMTAQAGLHNLPAEMRPAVAAAPGWQFVRADLGQIEPRVLAAVSGDAALAAATQADDLYAPVAARLGVERPVAKIAVLAAMYGQTSGAAGEALRGLDRAYPVAMQYLRAAEESGRAGHAVRTHGGRLVRMWEVPADADPQRERAARAARGRVARHAVVQGAAAELFKAWAVTVRARLVPIGGQIVLCLHDELLVHAPSQVAAEVAAILDDALAEAAARWEPSGAVRFVADTSIVARWSDAKS